MTIKTVLTTGGLLVSGTLVRMKATRVKEVRIMWPFRREQRTAHVSALVTPSLFGIRKIGRPLRLIAVAGCFVLGLAMIASPAALAKPNISKLEVNPNPYFAGGDEKLRVAFRISEGGNVALSAVKGRQLVFRKRLVVDAGRVATRWDGRDEFGRTASPGNYSVILQARNSSGWTKRWARVRVRIDINEEDVSAPLDEGSVRTKHLADKSVGAEQLDDGVIQARHIAAGVVASLALTDGAVKTNHLADSAVTAAKIADDAVGASEIATGAVGGAEIATDAVGADEIAADAVGSSEIAADAVGASEIATDAVSAAEIATDAVSAAEIATDAVGAAEIATGAVGGAEVADGSLREADLGVLAGSVGIDPPSQGANSCALVAVGVTGIAVSDRVILNAPSALEAGLIPTAVVQPTANNLTVRLCNVSGGAVDGALRTWFYIVTR